MPAEFFNMISGEAMKPDDYINSMKAYYDHRAPWHDEYMSYSGNARMEDLLRPIVDAIVPYVHGKRVLEVACGTGNWTITLAKRAKYVLALDSSPRVLEMARTKLRMVNNVQIECADVYDLQKISPAFDVAFASDWYSHMPKSMIPRFLTGLHQNLRSGAVVIFLDMSFRNVFQNDFLCYDEEGNRVNRRKVPDGTIFDVIKNFPTEEELRETLADWGNEFTYVTFGPLKRWMVRYRVR